MRIPMILATVFVALMALTLSVLAQEKPTAQTEGSPAASVPEIVSVAGEWEGELLAIGASSHTAKIRLNLRQNGKEVSGTYDWSGTRGWRNNVPVEGTLDGKVLQLKIPSLAYGRMEVRIDGNQMEGIYVGGSGWQNQLVAQKKK